MSSDAENQRSSDGRYPVAAEVAYQFVRDGRILKQGRGLSVKISSREILFRTDTSFPVGAFIAMQIAWPAKLDQEAAMILHVDGRTMRSDGNHTALAISRYEFRIRRETPI